MCESINNGLNASGELPGGLHVLRKAKSLSIGKENESSDITRMRKVSSYAYAVSEENASGGIIVTAPTCGSSGVLPAVLFYLQNEFLKNGEILIMKIEKLTEEMTEKIVGGSK